MKTIISLLFFCLICSAFEIDFENQGPEGPLKCSTRREYKACYDHCVESGFKKAICKNKQCECVGDNNEAFPYDDESKPNCLPRYCDLLCKKNGSESGSCTLENKCECSFEKLIKPFLEFEEPGVIEENLDADLKCSTLGEYYRCYEHCKKAGFFLPYCKNEKCSCITDRRKEFDELDFEPERNPRITCQINKWLCNKHCELHNFRYGKCNANHVCICYK